MAAAGEDVRGATGGEDPAGGGGVRAPATGAPTLAVPQSLAAKNYGKDSKGKGKKGYGYGYHGGGKMMKSSSKKYKAENKQKERAEDRTNREKGLSLFPTRGRASDDLPGRGAPSNRSLSPAEEEEAPHGGRGRARDEEALGLMQGSSLAGGELLRPRPEGETTPTERNGIGEGVTTGNRKNGSAPAFHNCRWWKGSEQIPPPILAKVYKVNPGDPTCTLLELHGQEPQQSDELEGAAATACSKSKVYYLDYMELGEKVAERIPVAELFRCQYAEDGGPPARAKNINPHQQIELRSNSLSPRERADMLQKVGLERTDENGSQAEMNAGASAAAALALAAAGANPDAGRPHNLDQEVPADVARVSTNDREDVPHADGDVVLAGGGINVKGENGAEDDDGTGDVEGDAANANGMESSSKQLHKHQLLNPFGSHDGADDDSHMDGELNLEGVGDDFVDQQNAETSEVVMRSAEHIPGPGAASGTPKGTTVKAAAPLVSAPTSHATGAEDQIAPALLIEGNSTKNTTASCGSGGSPSSSPGVPVPVLPLPVPPPAAEVVLGGAGSSCTPRLMPQPDNLTMAPPRHHEADLVGSYIKAREAAVNLFAFYEDPNRPNKVDLSRDIWMVGTPDRGYNEPPGYTSSKKVNAGVGSCAYSQSLRATFPTNGFPMSTIGKVVKYTRDGLAFVRRPGEKENVFYHMNTTRELRHHLREGDLLCCVIHMSRKGFPQASFPLWRLLHVGTNPLESAALQVVRALEDEDKEESLRECERTERYRLRREAEREKERERERAVEREKEKEKDRDREKDKERDKERERDARRAKSAAVGAGGSSYRSHSAGGTPSSYGDRSDYRGGRRGVFQTYPLYQNDDDGKPSARSKNEARDGGARDRSRDRDRRSRSRDRERAGTTHNKSSKRDGSPRSPKHTASSASSSSHGGTGAGGGALSTEISEQIAAVMKLPIPEKQKLEVIDTILKSLPAQPQENAASSTEQRGKVDASSKSKEKRRDSSSRCRASPAMHKRAADDKKGKLQMQKDSRKGSADSRRADEKKDKDRDRRDRDLDKKRKEKDDRRDSRSTPRRGSPGGAGNRSARERDLSRRRDIVIPGDHRKDTSKGHHQSDRLTLRGKSKDEHNRQKRKLSDRERDRVRGGIGVPGGLEESKESESESIDRPGRIDERSSSWAGGNKNNHSNQKQHAGVLNMKGRDHLRRETNNKGQSNNNQRHQQDRYMEKRRAQDGQSVFDPLSGQIVTQREMHQRNRTERHRLAVERDELFRQGVTEQDYGKKVTIKVPAANPNREGASKSMEADEVEYKTQEITVTNPLIKYGRPQQIDKISIGVISDERTPDGDHSVIQVLLNRSGSEQDMIFIENTYLEQYGLNPLDIVALSTYLNNDGFALANPQEIIWKYTDPFERVRSSKALESLSFGPYTGHVYKRTQQGACFVFSNDLMKVFEEDAYLTNTASTSAKIRVQDEIAFSITGISPKVNIGRGAADNAVSAIPTPLWVRCREKNELDSRRQNNFDLIKATTSGDIDAEKVSERMLASRAPGETERLGLKGGDAADAAAGPGGKSNYSARDGAGGKGKASSSTTGGAGAGASGSLLAAGVKRDRFRSASADVISSATSSKGGGFQGDQEDSQSYNYGEAGGTNPRRRRPMVYPLNVPDEESHLNAYQKPDSPGNKGKNGPGLTAESCSTSDCGPATGKARTQHRGRDVLGPYNYNHGNKNKSWDTSSKSKGKLSRDKSGSKDKYGNKNKGTAEDRDRDGRRRAKGQESTRTSLAGRSERERARSESSSIGRPTAGPNGKFSYNTHMGAGKR